MKTPRTAHSRILQRDETVVLTIDERVLSSFSDGRIQGGRKMANAVAIITIRGGDAQPVAPACVVNCLRVTPDISLR